MKRVNIKLVNIQENNRDTYYNRDFNNLEMCYQDCYSEQFFLIYIKDEFFFNFRNLVCKNIFIFI